MKHLPLTCGTSTKGDNYTNPWIHKALNITDKLGGKKVDDLINAFSDSHNIKILTQRSRNNSTQCEQLRQEIREWQMKCLLVEQELRKSTVKCKSLQTKLDKKMAKTENENFTNSLKSPALLKYWNKTKNCHSKSIHGRSKSLTNPDRNRAEKDNADVGLLNTCKSMKQELMYRDEVLGLTSLRKPKLCRRLYNTEMKKTKNENLKAEEECSNLREEVENLLEEIAFRDSALQYSEEAWEVIYMELLELFRPWTFTTPRTQQTPNVAELTPNLETKSKIVEKTLLGSSYRSSDTETAKTLRVHQRKEAEPVLNERFTDSADEAEAKPEELASGTHENNTVNVGMSASRMIGVCVSVSFAAVFIRPIIMFYLHGM